MKRLLPAILLLLIAAGIYLLPVAGYLDALVSWSETNKLAGASLYVLFVILATIFFLPGSVAMMLGGYVFGFLPGFFLAALAIPLGAQAAFVFARWVARPWVRERIQGNQRIAAIEAALREQAVLVVILTRLSLIIPFNVLNYAYGATAIRASLHILGTAIGMLPAVALYVYLGTLAGNVSQILEGDATPSALGYWIAALGVIAIVFASWIIHRTATAALEKHLNN